jgi:hypothetical protein
VKRVSLSDFRFVAKYFWGSVPPMQRFQQLAFTGMHFGFSLRGVVVGSEYVQHAVNKE